MDIFALSQVDLWVSLPVLLVIVAGVLLGLYQLKQPAAAGEDAPANQFSAGRAFLHLQIIASEPHPPGTPAHLAVGDYLLKELTGLGLECRVQEATAVNTTFGPPYACGRVRNIMARLPGENSSQKILISVHYDSVPGSPGATDDGSAVAALLETARILKAGPALQNEIIFLFVDGEEVGLLGSQSFVDSHPWAKEVGLVINFDARGTRGPVLMYETSGGNQALIKEFSRAVPYPVANSISYEVSKRLPNFTDFDVYKKTGWPGLNFACVGKLIHYHSALDGLDNLDPGLLQHQGSYALGLLRHFGNLDLEKLNKGDNAAYFNPFRGILWSYSEKWNLPLVLVTVLGYAGSVVAGIGLNLLNWLNLGLGFLVFWGGAGTASAVTFILWVLIRRLHPQYGVFKFGDTYNSRYYTLGFTFLALAISGSLYGWFAGGSGGFNLWAGALLGWLLLLIAVHTFFPSTGYLAVWPLLLNLAALNFLFLAQNASAPVKLLIYAVFALPVLLLLVPVISLFFDALSLRLAWLVIGLVGLGAGLLAPFILILAGPSNWLLTLVLIVAGLGCLEAGSLTSTFNSERRRPDDIFYGLDTDTGVAVWASASQSNDEYTGQFFGKKGANSEEPEFEKYPDFFLSPRLMNSKVLQGKAPLAELSRPVVETLEDLTHGDERTLHLRISSGRKAPVLSVFMDTDANPKLISASLAGIALTDPPGSKPPSRWGLRFWALPEEGFELELKVKNTGPLTLRIIDQSFGLPVFQDAKFIPRPDYIMPTAYQGFIPDSTLVKKSFNF